MRNKSATLAKGTVAAGTASNRFWSLLKRGVLGSYHNVSKKYLPLYLPEF
jgi:hypothetical protein